MPCHLHPLDCVFLLRVLFSFLQPYYHTTTPHAQTTNLNVLRPLHTDLSPFQKHTRASRRAWTLCTLRATQDKGLLLECSHVHCMHSKKTTSYGTWKLLFVNVSMSSLRIPQKDVSCLVFLAHIHTTLHYVKYVSVYIYFCELFVG
jgi:hypothetical protein